MEEDKLRSFIRENKEAFDSEKAPPRVWDRVEKEMGQTQKGGFISMKKMWFILAAVVGVFTIAGIIGANYMSTENNNAEQQFASIEANEYQQMQKHYEPLLQQKEQTFVKQVNAPSVIDELGELDAGFRELQNDFLNSAAGNKEIMMKLMKENYELRIQILEMAMNKIQMDADGKNEFNKQIQKNEY